MMVWLKRLALAGVAMIALSPAASAQCPDCCSDCEDEYVEATETHIHRLTGYSYIVNCSGGMGHPTHQCSGDPPSEWSTGDCWTHTDCGWSLVEPLKVRGKVPEVMIWRVAALDPEGVRYDARAGRAALFNCVGRLVAVVDVQKTNVALRAGSAQPGYSSEVALAITAHRRP